ncbi:hypothetical protein HDE78_004074 [Rhodanobacter sp. K2T2]|nr:hypothetical protein [Rhodanobacter sp. K2T2]
MDSIELVLAMLLAVVASSYVVRILPLPIPLPLVQIAMGAGIAGVLDHGVVLDPQIFFLLFLPPLLFLDGWRIPKDGLLRDKTVILQLALGLVVFGDCGHRKVAAPADGEKRRGRRRNVFPCRRTRDCALSASTGSRCIERNRGQAVAQGRRD